MDTLLRLGRFYELADAISDFAIDGTFDGWWNRSGNHLNTR